MKIIELAIPKELEWKYACPQKKPFFRMDREIKIKAPPFRAAPFGPS